MGPNEAQKLLLSKGSHKQNEKATHRMGENICKWCDWLAINLQNLQTAHAAQYQKTKQSNQKMGQDICPKETYRWPRSAWKNTWHH